MPLQFVTKTGAKGNVLHFSAAAEAHNTAKRKEREPPGEDGKPNRKQMPLKFRAKRNPQQLLRAPTSTLTVSSARQLKFVAFGGVENHSFVQVMAQEYGLDFVPYLVVVRCGLYHGCRLLTSWSQQYSREVPFSLAPRFHQELRFAGVRLSQLPLESRLCFDIVVKGAFG